MSSAKGKYRIIVWLLLTIQFVSGQKSFMEELRYKLEQLPPAGTDLKADTLRCRYIRQMCDSVGEEEYLSINSQLQQLSEKYLAKIPGDKSSPLQVFFKQHLSVALNNLGYLMEMQNNDAKALEYYSKALPIDKELDNKQSLGLTYNSLGQIYLNRGNVSMGLEYYMRSLKLNEELKDPIGIAACLNNLATIYEEQGDYKKAIELYERALKIRMETNNGSGAVNTYINLSVAQDKMGDPANAERTLQKALELSTKVGYEQGIGYCYANLGSLAQESGDLDKALEYFQRSEEIIAKGRNLRSKAQALTNIARIYYKKRQYQKAVKIGAEAMKYGEGSGSPEAIRNTSELLYKIYGSLGEHKEALTNYELFIRMRDSISNESTRKASIRSQLKYEYEKQAAADSVAFAKEAEVKDAELKRQEAEIKAKKNQQYALFGGLALVMVFAGFMYNRFKVTQKQKIVIESQKREVEMAKELVDEKQREILDSIHYARRIQLAQIPSDRALQTQLSKLMRN